MQRIEIDKNEKLINNKFITISFVCSILVIYIHTFNLEIYSIDENSIGIARATYIIETYWSNVLKIAVPMFFFISGILFFRTFEISKLLQKWYSGIFSIAIPYAIWCTFYYVYNVLCTNISQIKMMMGNIEVVALSLPEWLKWLWYNEYYTLWFLKNLIVYIALAPIIWILLKNHTKKLPTGIIAIIILVIGIRINKNIPYTNGLEEYLVGCYIGINCRDILYYKNKIISALSMIYVIIIFINDFKIWGLILELLFFVAVWYAMDILSSYLQNELPWWMTIGFFTYVAHDIFLEAFEKILWMVGGNQAILALLDYVFMPVFVEFLLIVISYIAMRWFPGMWKIITGNRGTMYCRKCDKQF